MRIDLLRIAAWLALGLTAALSSATAAWDPDPPEPVGFRISAGSGYGVGSNSGSYRIDHGSLDLQSVTGGSGPVVTANLWVDHIWSSDLSLGFEFLRIMNGATANLTLPRGISILTDPTIGQAKLSATGDLGIIDLVYRPRLETSGLSLYAGGGVGGGLGRAAANLSVYNPAIGSFSQQSTVNSPIGGIHGVVGIDFYVTKSVFFSLSPQILFMTGHPVGLSQSYVDMMFTGSVGYSFN